MCLMMIFPALERIVTLMLVTGGWQELLLTRRACKVNVKYLRPCVSPGVSKRCKPNTAE